MTTCPMTKAEAEKYRYDKSFINPGGFAYDPTRCATEVNGSFSWHRYQCLRHPEKGPDGLYCTQHARIIEARTNNSTK